jgi:coenzyme F420-dependent glucose-6-phosphate dehydrogenase
VSGVLDSVRGLLWARKHRPGQAPYLVSLAHERFPPPELVRQAVEAEQAG